MRRFPFALLMLSTLLAIAFSAPARAQLAECQHLSIDPAAIPNGCIGKTLSEQVGSGHGDVNTPGSAVYLIKRDPARSIRRGRQLFQRKFTEDEGFGPRVNASSSGDVNVTRALGAALADSCAACHGRPKGSAGFGGDVATRPDSRDAPHLFGLGLVEQLANEMTMTLREQRDRVVARAQARSRSVSTRLVAKGVYFGTVAARSDGSVDMRNVQGIDGDLRVRPFFHHGGTVSIREFVIGALNDEMGLQAWDPVLCAVTDPDDKQLMTSPAGFVFDPAQDMFARPKVCNASTDQDADGVSGEIDPALVDHMEFYLLNYFKPGQYRQSPFALQGQRVLDGIGCTDCHTRRMTIDSDRRVADVDTQYDPTRGIFNDLFASATTRFVVEEDGDPYPMLLPTGDAFVVDNFYSDLKRHDLGPAFHERDYDGSLVTEFVTEPLWGVGSTAPYGHDGRSINLDAVIRRHGGEATRARRGYERLGEVQRMSVINFLETLVLFPPDDTASNLNPGNPADRSNIQDPAVHGTINLGALFQIDEEGPE